MRLALTTGAGTFAAFALAASVYDCGDARASDPSWQERLTVERHLAACSRTSPDADPWAVLTILRVERDVGAPEGLLTSAACWETGFAPDARGDWLDGYPRAHGLLQLHAWFLPWCGYTPDARDDAEAAARCYWRRIEYYLGKPEVQACKRPLEVAEARAANGPKYLPWKCSARSAHGHELARWGHK